MRVVLAALLLLAAESSTSYPVVDIAPRSCKPGIHEQPGGAFGLFVFCDDALGTNIAVVMKDLEDPSRGPYTLGKRFWQEQEWSYDATSYAWLPANRLLVSTSTVYGSGKVYLLRLEQQQAKVVLSTPAGACVLELRQVTDKHATVAVTDCESLKESTVGFAI